MALKSMEKPSLQVRLQARERPLPPRSLRHRQNHLLLLSKSIKNVRRKLACVL
jgi:hypothetical protein